MARVSRLRRDFRRLRGHVEVQLLAVCLRCWSQNGPSFHDIVSQSAWFCRATLADAWYKQTLDTQCKRLRRACREDRAAYISSLADKLASCPHADVFQQVHRILNHQRKKPYQADPLPVIRQADGQVCEDAEAARGRWRQHFGGLEAGREVSVHDIAAEAMQEPPMRWPSPCNLNDIPAKTLLHRVLAAGKSHKAAGPDGIPAELGKSFPSEVADILYPLLLKYVFRGAEAVGHKAGVAVFFWKGRGSQQECSSYPAILLLNAWAKALHQALRPRALELYHSSAPPLQLGSRPGGNVVFGSHIVRAFQRWASNSKKSSFVLFADITAAYYSTVRELIAAAPGNSGGAPPDKALANLELSPDDLMRLKEHAAALTAFRRAGADTWTEAVSHCITRGTFFLIRGDHVAVATDRGTRPGSSWADILFATVMQRVLDRLCECPSSADTAIALETGCLVDAFREHGFSLTFGERKTAILATPGRAGSNSLRAEIAYRAGQAYAAFAEGLGRESEQDVSFHTCLALVGLPSPANILRRHRLLYLAQAMRCAPDALWALIRADRPYADALTEAFRWLYSHVGEQAGLPEPSQGWNTWAEIMCQRPGRFKGLVKRAIALEQARHTMVAALDGLHRGMSGGAGCVQDADAFMRLRGTFSEAHSQCPSEEFCTPLLEALLAFTDPESDLWECVSDHVAPLATIRRTVDEWPRQETAQTWARNSADDLLLLLDPAVFCESIQPPPPKRDCPADTLPSWPQVPPRAFVSTGEPAYFQLPPPPPTRLSLTQPGGITVSDAAAYACWIQGACRVIAEAIAISAQQPFVISCPGDALPALAALLKALLQPQGSATHALLACMRRKETTIAAWQTEVLADPSRINDLGWTDAHHVAYGWPIQAASGKTFSVPPERHHMSSFFKQVTDEFLCLRNDFGQTALHLAVRQEHDELVSFFVLTRKIPCLDVGNGDGDTPLHYAAAWGRRESARLLIQGGADPFILNKQGKTPMDDALSFGHPEIWSIMSQEKMPQHAKSLEL
ncbi:ANKRD27 [Symbiodinium sp. CCMP2456]|nr:ANKRD27 [Symbiodinium sp. CCMP2456]